MSEYYARCSCHPTVDTGTGEMCLNCKDSVCKTHRENGTGGYCNNSTRQADWFSHRKDVEHRDKVKTWDYKLGGD